MALNVASLWTMPSDEGEKCSKSVRGKWATLRQFPLFCLLELGSWFKVCGARTRCRCCLFLWRLKPSAWLSVTIQWNLKQNQFWKISHNYASSDLSLGGLTFSLSLSLPLSLSSSPSLFFFSFPFPFFTLLVPEAKISKLSVCSMLGNAHFYFVFFF